MSVINSWIPRAALAFSVVATGVAVHDHFNKASVNETADLVKTVMPAVAHISVTVAGAGAEEGGMLGTGFIIDGKNGYIVTNNHVIAKGSKIIVELQNKRKFTATLVGADELSDIAVLKIKSDTVLPQETFADSDTIRVGEPVIAIGSPFGFSYSVSHGIISALGRITDSPVQRLIQSDTPVNPGNSGGPLFNKDGKVIGVNNEIYSRTGTTAGISFAIPSNLVKLVAAKLIADKKMHWGYMGISMGMTKSGPKISTAESDDPQNVIIENVAAGSPAEKAGLKAGDILLSVNDQNIQDRADAQSKILPLMSGAKADIAYLRDKVKGHVVVTLGEQPVQTEKKTDDEAPAPTPSPSAPVPTPEKGPAPKFHFGAPHP